jgi:hypothetical protein
MWPNFPGIFILIFALSGVEKVGRIAKERESFLQTMLLQVLQDDTHNSGASRFGKMHKHWQ